MKRRFRRPGQGGGRLALGLFIALLVMMADQASKWWILEVVMQPVPQVVEVTDFFNLVLAWNPGVSFGMLQFGPDIMPYVLSGVAVLVSLVLLTWLAKAERGFQALALGLIVGGAVGNVIDRFRFGAVCDFLDFYAFGWHFWTFNVADAGISVGVTFLLIDGLFAGGESA